MNDAPATTDSRPARTGPALARSTDWQGADRLVWLGAALLVAAALLPWVEVRPNRLAPGEWLRLGPWSLMLVGFAATLSLLARRPVWGALAANLALVGVFALLALATRAALEGELPIARAGAASGFWIGLLGAGVALWGALFALRALGSRRARWFGWLWAVPVLALVLTGGLSTWSVWVEGRAEGPRLLQELLVHVRLVLTALLIALVIGGPLAVWASRSERVSRLALSIAGGVQTLPSLALLGLLIAPLAWLANTLPALREVGVSGIGTAPALVALTLYALLPVLRNGVVALQGVNAATLDAARGMGMTDNQRFWRVQLPLALPVWLAGLRQATALLVGVTAVAALIGAGGLGVFIFRGLNSASTDLILLGAIPASLLALAGDGLWRALQGWLARRYAQA